MSIGIDACLVIMFSNELVKAPELFLFDPKDRCGAYRLSIYRNQGHGGRVLKIEVLSLF